MAEKQLAALQAQNAALKTELANLQRLAAAKAAAESADAPAPPVLGDRQASDASDQAIAAQSEDRVRALFAHYDADASGLIDRHEFAALVADLGEVLDEAELTAALAAIDSSGDGNISFDGTITGSGRRLCRDCRHSVRRVEQ